MAEQKSRGRAAVKFLFWTAAAAGVLAVVIHSFRSGQMTSWYYYQAAGDGYAVNADVFRDATPEHPAELEIAAVEEIAGFQAVPVRAGDRLPRNANGVISARIVEEGRRVTADGATLSVLVPWEIQQSKGFKYKDTFKHKGIRTYGWAAVWNVLILFALGITLGFMAEGFTDLIGLRIGRMHHHVGH